MEMAAKTSIINENRNPTLNQEEIEIELTKYLGVTNFIWITGIRGEDNYDKDTDYHIDGAARFVNENTILMNMILLGKESRTFWRRRKSIIKNCDKREI